MMPAERPRGGTDGASVLEWMLAYASYGYSVIPILPGSKKPFGYLLPNGKWSKYQQTPADEDEINRWVTARPDTGVGIVCGKVSGGLVCLDIDDVEFSNYIETQAGAWAEKGVWVDRSGSGKLHLFVKSKETVYSGHLIGGGKKLADIRGDGGNNRGPSYMVVSPSIHPDTGSPYEVFKGDPERVGTVGDARMLFDLIRDDYSGVKGGDIIVRRDDGYDTNDDRILDPPEGSELDQFKDELMSDIRVSRKIKRAILDGAEAGEGQWSTAPSNSELDHYVIRELRAAGWPVEKIERAFAWGPLGNHRYRSHKGTRGRGYILGSLNKIDADIKRANEAGKSAEGSNFKVDRVVRVGFEEPLFELHVSSNTGRTGVARLDIDDLMDEHRFSKAVGKALNFFPVVDRALEGRRFRKFGSLLLQMAVEEAVPQSATVGGHLRATIMAFVLDETPAPPQEPEDPRYITLGWRQDGAAFIRGGALLQRLQNVVHPKPKPDDVWRTLRGMGAQEMGHRWPTGKVEALWVVPVGRPDAPRTNGLA